MGWKRREQTHTHRTERGKRQEREASARGLLWPCTQREQQQIVRERERERMQARVCMHVCVHCVLFVYVCGCSSGRVPKSPQSYRVVSSQDLGLSLHVLSLSFSRSLGSLSRKNLPLEYPMGPFYRGKFCDRARETDTATTT